MIEEKSTETKNILLAVFLSLLFPGLGQLYAGKTNRGIAFILIAISLWFSMFILIGFILYPIFLVYNIFDVIKIIENINKENAKR